MLRVKARVRASPNQTPNQTPNQPPSREQVVRGMELVHAIQNLPTLPDDTTRPQQPVVIEDCGEVDSPASDGAPPAAAPVTAASTPITPAPIPPPALATLPPGEGPEEGSEEGGVRIILSLIRSAPTGRPSSLGARACASIDPTPSIASRFHPG